MDNHALESLLMRLQPILPPKEVCDRLTVSIAGKGKANYTSGRGNFFRQQAAFTLVELLMVVAIISILAAMLMPMLAKARETARAAVCANQLKQGGLALMSYCDDNQGWLPFYEFWSRNVGGYLTEKKWEYNDGWNVPIFGFNDAYMASHVPVRTFMPCPSGTPGYANTYGGNYPSVFGKANLADATLGRSRKLSRVPIKNIVVSDAISSALYSPSFSSAYLQYLPGDSDHPYCNFSTIHNGRANSLFSDLHVATVQLDDWVNGTANDVWGPYPIRP